MIFKAKTIGGKIERKTSVQIIPNRNLWISQKSEYKSMKRNKMLVGDKIL